VCEEESGLLPLKRFRDRKFSPSKKRDAHEIEESTPPPITGSEGKTVRVNETYHAQQKGRDMQYESSMGNVRGGKKRGPHESTQTPKPDYPRTHGGGKEKGGKNH